MYCHCSFSLKRTDSSLAYLPYRVSEEDFRNCNFSSAVAIVADKTAGPIVVEQKYLQPGPNYFIGKVLLMLFSSFKEESLPDEKGSLITRINVDV